MRRFGSWSTATSTHTWFATGSAPTARWSGNTRTPDTDPGTLWVTVVGPLDSDPGVIDVRDLMPQRRHEEILDTVADLAAGEGVVLMTDHNLKQLYHQFEAKAGPAFR